jgi:hypothetical protein
MEGDVEFEGKSDAGVAAPTFPKSEGEVVSSGLSGNIFLEGASVYKGTSLASLGGA